MNSRWTCMLPHSACLLRRVLGPWSKQSLWPPIRKRAARPLAAVPPSIRSRRVPWPLCSPAPRVRRTSQASWERWPLAGRRSPDRVSKPDGIELAASASVCLGSAAPVRLESASVSVSSPPAFPTPASRPSFAFLWSNGNSVGKCSSNMAADSKCRSQ